MLGKAARHNARPVFTYTEQVLEEFRLAGTGLYQNDAWRPPRLRSGKSAWGGKGGRRGDRRSPPPVELLPDRYGRMISAITRVGSGVGRAIAMGARRSGRRGCI